MIISVLAKNGGFYSQLMFLFNHYIYAEINNVSFKISDNNWLFKYELGWTDYFENIDVTRNTTRIHITKSQSQICQNFPLHMYRHFIGKIYKYNNSIKNKILETKTNLNLLTNNYDSIFIRRGDKLFGESIIIPSEKYIDLLLNINPDCKIIFLQTDDYNCFLEIENYLKQLKKEIKLITLCDSNLKGGVTVFKFFKNKLNTIGSSYQQNNNYIKNNINDINKVKSVDEMNKIEISKHVTDMIIGIDIVLNSQYCICEYSSNVSRFIKLTHKNPNNVINILDPTKDINWNSTICPGGDHLS